MSSYRLILHDPELHCDWTKWNSNIFATHVVIPKTTLCWADACKTRIDVAAHASTCKHCSIPKYCSEQCAKDHFNEHKKWCAVGVKSKKPTTHTIVILVKKHAHQTSPRIEQYRAAFKLCLEVLLSSASSPSVNLHPDHAFFFFRSDFKSKGHNNWDKRAIRRIIDTDHDYDFHSDRIDALSMSDMKIMLNCGLNISHMAYALTVNGNIPAMAAVVDYCSEQYHVNLGVVDAFVAFRPLLSYDQRHQFVNKLYLPKHAYSKSVIFDGYDTADRELIVRRQNTHFLLQFLPSAKQKSLIFTRPLCESRLLSLLLRYAEPSHLVDNSFSFSRNSLVYIPGEIG